MKRSARENVEIERSLAECMRRMTLLKQHLEEARDSDQPLRSRMHLTDEVEGLRTAVKNFGRKL